MGGSDAPPPMHGPAPSFIILPADNQPLSVSLAGNNIDNNNVTLHPISSKSLTPRPSTNTRRSTSCSGYEDDYGKLFEPLAKVEISPGFQLNQEVHTTTTTTRRWHWRRRRWWQTQPFFELQTWDFAWKFILMMMMTTTTLTTTTTTNSAIIWATDLRFCMEVHIEKL